VLRPYRFAPLIDIVTVKSDAASDLPPERRMSGEGILHYIDTFMIAGIDTTSLAVT
jgi:hypothetical protein